MSEEQLQAKCFQWHHNTFPLERGMLHHNNNNSVNRIAGNKARSMGVVAGVSDFELILDDCVWFIEMKTPAGSLSPEQKDFRAKVLSRNHAYFVIRTFETFKELIFKAYAKR